jgi:hypothetical protein
MTIIIVAIITNYDNLDLITNIVRITII